MLALASDPDWAVREQLARVARRAAARPEGSRDWRRSSSSTANDPVAMDAALSGLNGSEAAVLEILLQRDGRNAAARDGDHDAGGDDRVDGAQDAPIQRAVRRGRRRAACRRGSARRCCAAPRSRCSALTPPGSAGRGRGRGAAAAADAPCPTVPAAARVRAALPRFRAGEAAADPALRRRAAQGGGRRARRTRPRRRQAGAEADARAGDRSALAANGGDLAARAPRVLARLEWPGKPGMAAPAAPLTPGGAGALRRPAATVYQNLCQACHQPDGRGREKLAPSLIGSEFALAASPDDSDPRSC